MIAGRDSKGHFIKGNVPWNKRVASSQSEMTTFGDREVIGGGLLKLARVQVICPACGEQGEAVAKDGQVKGYCAVAKQAVDFPIETQRLAKHLTVEHRAEISAAHASKYFSAEHRAKLSAASKKVWQDPEYQAKQIATHKGKHHTVEAKTKISSALNTAETRGKISAAHRGKHLPAETKAKMSEAHMGKHLTAEHRAKISAALKRRHPA